MFIDPGGYFNNYFNLPEIRFLLPFFIAFMPIITSINYRRKINKDIIKPIRFFTPFLVYLIIVYFGIQNKQDFTGFKDLLYMGIYSSIFLLIPIIYKNVFITTLQNPILPIWVFAIYATIVGILFILTTQFDYDLIFVKQANRYGLERIVTYQYGNQIYTPFIFMLFLKFPKKNWVLSSFIIATSITGLFIFFVDMSRGRYFIMALIFVILYYFRYKLGYSKIIRDLFILGLLILLLNTYLSPYLKQTGTLVEDAYLTTTTGITTEEKEEGRFIKDYGKHLELFFNNPALGHGYTTKWYDNGLDDYSASDLPLSGGIGMFGIIGLALYLYFVFGLIRFIYKKITMVVKFNVKEISFDFALMLVLFSIIISRYLIPFYYFQEIIRPQLTLIFFTFISLGMAYYNKFFYNKNIESFV